MKRKDAISKAKAIRPSEFTDLDLAKWLCDLDGHLMLEYISQYATDEELNETYGGLGVVDGIAAVNAVIETGSTTSQSWTAMINGDLQAVPAPYDSLYIDYLVMMIDLNNADYERYDNDLALYTRKLQTWLNRLSGRNWNRNSRDDPEHGTIQINLRF